MRPFFSIFSKNNPLNNFKSGFDEKKVAKLLSQAERKIKKGDYKLPPEIPEIGENVTVAIFNPLSQQCEVHECVVNSRYFCMSINDNCPETDESALTLGELAFVGIEVSISANDPIMFQGGQVFLDYRKLYFDIKKRIWSFKMMKTFLQPKQIPATLIRNPSEKK